MPHSSWHVTVTNEGWTSRPVSRRYAILCSTNRGLATPRRPLEDTGIRWFVRGVETGLDRRLRPACRTGPSFGLSLIPAQGQPGTTNRRMRRGNSHCT